MSEKYKLNFIEEENKFKNLLLKSIQHELHTPINFVLSSSELLYSQFQLRYAQIFENENPMQEIIEVFEEIGIKKDYQDAIGFIRKS
jgi:signal transduction histidine kinase